ncbi:hypothetical protein AAC387_Pa06g1378 [Persea americana]
MFSAQSQAHIIQLHRQLTSLKKGGLSIQDYFQKAKTLAHTLTAIGQTVEASDVVAYILAGIPSEYHSLVAVVTTRIETVTLDALYGFLLSHELRLEQQTAIVELG